MSEDLGPLTLSERPPLRRPVLLAAFLGWPDAGEVATGALRYLTAKLNGRRLGHIELDGFVDYTDVRPVTLIEKGVIQLQRYPAADIYYWQDPVGESDLLMLLSAEPQLSWQRFKKVVLSLMDQFGAELLISLGGMYDAVPHTAQPRVSGLATSDALRLRLAELDVNLTDYHGPSSIHTALAYACREAGKHSLSLWGHTPVYVRTVANPKTCHALLSRLCTLLVLPLHLDDLRVAGEYLDQKLNRLLDQNEGLRMYISRLEEQLGGAVEPAAPGGEAADTERIIRDVEEFLRGEQHRGDEG